MCKYCGGDTSYHSRLALHRIYECISCGAEFREEIGNMPRTLYLGTDGRIHTKLHNCAGQEIIIPIPLGRVLTLRCIECGTPQEYEAIARGRLLLTSLPPDACGGGIVGRESSLTAGAGDVFR